MPPLSNSAGSRALAICFWISWSISAVVASVVLYFFFAGIRDGSVSSFNMLLWLALVGGVVLVVGGSLVLRAAGKLMLALVLSLLLAIPGVLLGLFFLILIVSHPRWN
jgi:hypothetical protein